MRPPGLVSPFLLFHCWGWCHAWGFFLSPSLKHVTKCSPVLSATPLLLKASPGYCSPGESWLSSKLWGQFYVTEKGFIFKIYFWIICWDFFFCIYTILKSTFFIFKYIFFYGNDNLPRLFQKRLCRILLCVHAQWLSHIQLFWDPWTTVCQTPLSMQSPRQEYWSVLPFPPPGDLPNPGTEPVSPALAGGIVTTRASWEPRDSTLWRHNWCIQFPTARLNLGCLQFFKQHHVLAALVRFHPWVNFTK